MLFIVLSKVTVVFLALFFDSLLSSGQFPLFTTTICVIVIVYELIKPHLYTSRR